MNDQAPAAGGPLSPDQIIQLLRFAIRDGKNHGRGAPVVSFGLHVAESIIHALRAEKRAEVSAAVRSHAALVSSLEEMTPAMPPRENGFCHVGIVTQDKCRNCQRIARAHAALKDAKVKP